MPDTAPSGYWRFVPTLSLRSWLGVSYLLVLVLPIVALLATGALQNDLQNQTKWDLEHQGVLIGLLAAAHLQSEPTSKLSDHSLALSTHLRRAKRATLSGIRIVDRTGEVVASSGHPSDLGVDLSGDAEVVAALGGKVSAILRPREGTSAPLASPSRRAKVRVFVAVPITVDGERLGAVVISRTPREEIQALYQMAPSGLLVGALLALLVTVLFAFASSWVLSRSLTTLSRGSRRISGGHFDGLELLARPKSSHVREVGWAARSVEAMAVRLQERLAYIGEFASNVSHEFKTPLSTLKGTLELMTDDPDMPGEQRARFLSNATESVDRLERMVSGLLSLARADEGGDHQVVDLQALVAEVADRYGATVEGLAGSVRGDLAQLDSVLCNFFENARVHGGRARVIGFVGGDSTGFSVADDGKGISAANLAQVFDRFFTTNRTGGSSGLGLALVRAIVFTHGGEVTVRSIPGETVFTVTLPALGAP